MSTSTLLVMRHAKSSWQNEGLSDFERPLNKRGLKAAPLMAGTLAKRELIPDILISSSAVRARQTTELVVAEWEKPVEVIFEDSLYLAHPESYVEAIAQYCTDQQRVMVVGHNPGLEYLIESLSGEGEVMPTGAVAIMTTLSTWNQLQQCELVEVLRPKEI